MSEKKLYQEFKKHWPNYIERIEPKNETGIPDLLLVDDNGLAIFVELKYIAKKFNEMILPIKKTQFIWHKKITTERSYVVFQVENEYYIFSSCDVFNLRGKVTWDKFKKLAYFEANKMETVCYFLS